MMKKVLIAAVLASFAACDKFKEVADIKPDKVAISRTDTSIEAIPDHCMLKVDGQDSVFLKFSDNLGTITGQLITGGTVQDVVGLGSGDTLKLDIMKSLENPADLKEFWLLRDGKNYLQASAKYGADQRYIRGNTVPFDAEHPFEMVDCTTFDQALKRAKKPEPAIAPVAAVHSGTTKEKEKSGQEHKEEKTITETAQSRNASAKDKSAANSEKIAKSKSENKTESRKSSPSTAEPIKKVTKTETTVKKSAEKTPTSKTGTVKSSTDPKKKSPTTQTEKSVKN